MDTTLLIGDIVERDSRESKQVEFPVAPSSSTGFPQHKRRWKGSAFKQQRSGGASRLSAHTDENKASIQDGRQAKNFDEVEKTRIDQENRQKLASMSPQEIAQAQDDILNGLNPGLIQRLLQRANIDEASSSPSPFDEPNPKNDTEAQGAEQPQILPPQVRTANSEQAPSAESGTPSARPVPSSDVKDGLETPQKKVVDNYDEDQAPARIPQELFPITDQPKSTHFPASPSLPDLDPSDPDFLAALHQKYFPNLPTDPSKLAWMAPVPTQDSVADKDSPYYPHPEIAVSALRFDFRGRFLSPRVSRSIPSTKGLHHHGEAPEAAGYTIAELSRLARSAVPAQRCMAYQTLGRILYRLGQGEWGKTEDHPIAMGIWTAMKKGRVLESLMEAAAGEGGHRGSRAFATEALWLFERGGWREKFKGR
ncbi:hypothetical protein C2857_002452 [Epichloe festucae Fl1]|uniref:Transcription factor Rba50 n=1 Tax=Epichloe festucae (strain Fl1) TaxID=877507 RepID=A0A7S9KK24_EPIFF|nr:hypothetical protein C2857_002452 [Epichloe festucae Fl1]